MSRRYHTNVVYEQSFFLNELESLGFTTIRLNEFNDDRELNNLVNCVKENFLKEYRGQAEM